MTAPHLRYPIPFAQPTTRSLSKLAPRSALLLALGATSLIGCGGGAHGRCAENPSSRAAEGSSAPRASLALWNPGPTRKSLEDFVARVTDPKSPDFVPLGQRIAVFDNDGTLWSEQPMYVQLAFALDRVRALAPNHPEWAEKEPFKSVLAGDLAGLHAAGTAGLMELVMATHAGMTTEEFEQTVTDWLKTARHPRFKKPYTELTYAPMVELLGYLRENGFKTFIVSGGGVGFMRPFVSAAYGIPREQVVGTRLELAYERAASGPVLRRDPKVTFIDDGPGKPVGIMDVIGQRPLIAVGNSDGDLQMLEWTKAGPGARLAVLLHHTDGEREVAYDRESSFGKLDKALDLAAKDGWVIVDMKKDWAKVFASERMSE